MKQNREIRYDVFITGCVELARSLFQTLERKGYRVYLDEGASADESLYRIINCCRDVVVVLDANAWRGCADRAEPLRLKIVRAVERERNLVIVSAPGFDRTAAQTPANLPEELADFWAVTPVDMNQVPRALKARPRWTVRRTLLCAAVTLVLVFAGSVLWQGAFQEFPRTARERALVSEMQSAVEMQVVRYQTVTAAYDAFLENERVCAGKSDALDADAFIARAHAFAEESLSYASLDRKMGDIVLRLGNSPIDVAALNEVLCAPDVRRREIVSELAELTAVLRCPSETMRNDWTRMLERRIRNAGERRKDFNATVAKVKGGTR